MFKLNRGEYALVFVLVIMVWSCTCNDLKPIEHHEKASASQSHKFSPSVSNQLSEAIKIKMYPFLIMQHLKPLHFH